MITRQAVTHIPLSQYAFANREGNVTFRLRAGRGELTGCRLYFADRFDPQGPGRFLELEMERTARDAYFDYFSVTFDSPYTRLCYCFALEDGQERLILAADQFRSDLPGELYELYQYPYLRREEISAVPDWLRHGVVYNIFPDSFASGRRSITGTGERTAWGEGLTLETRLGGTLQGIIDNLDYIAGLGFNCIYLNPVFTAGTYHRYDTLDYWHISPNFGTNEQFRQMVDKAHGLGMRVIIDGVFNHCSWDFFAFDDVVRRGEQSRYKNWFYDLTFPVERPGPGQRPGYACFSYERRMPKLNTSDPQVREYFLQVCEYWLREYGVDGWRLDVANEVDREFWRAFRRRSRRAKADSVLIGEVWESAERWLQGDMFHSAMNYAFRKNCGDFFARGAIDAAQFDARVTQMHYRYPTGIVQGQLNLLDSHDVSRFLTLCGEDSRRLKLAEVFLFTAPGVPCVFYGDELGMRGEAELDFRSPMAWDAPPEDLREFFRALIALRRDTPALAEGDYRTLAARDRLYAFARRGEGCRVTVCLNAGDRPEDLTGVAPEGEPVLAEGWDGAGLAPWGYGIWMEQS